MSAVWTAWRSVLSRGSAIFDSHGGDSDLDVRTGQVVEVLGALDSREADVHLEEVGPMFAIRFSDGLVVHAFLDELAG